MCKLLIFGGTTEGRALAEFCAENQIKAYISVVSEYGAGLLPSSEFLNILQGKMDSGMMEQFIAQKDITMVIDATHPYAEEVSANINSVCGKLGISLHRIKRKEDMPCKDGIYFNTVEEVAVYLNTVSGKVLITTGSKEAAVFLSVDNYRERCTLRVLDSEKVIADCIAMGYGKERIISEKGPFTVEINVEHISLAGADYIVTKDSGQAGGFPEKIKAAEICKVIPLIIKRPSENGISTEETEKILSENYYG